MAPTISEQCDDVGNERSVHTSRHDVQMNRHVRPSGLASSAPARSHNRDDKDDKDDNVNDAVLFKALRPPFCTNITFPASAFDQPAFQRTQLVHSSADDAPVDPALDCATSATSTGEIPSTQADLAAQAVHVAIPAKAPRPRPRRRPPTTRAHLTQIDPTTCRAPPITLGVHVSHVHVSYSTCSGSRRPAPSGDAIHLRLPTVAVITLTVAATHDKGDAHANVKGTSVDSRSWLLSCFQCISPVWVAALTLISGVKPPPYVPVLSITAVSHVQFATSYLRHEQHHNNHTRISRHFIFIHVDHL